MRPPPEASRRERKKAAVHRRILACALALFEERGFAATRVAEICERADVAQKTFFNHFPSKQHLLREIAGESLDRLLGGVEEVRKAPVSTAERLRRFFAFVAENAGAAGPMHRELLTELIHVAHEAGTETEQAQRLQEAFAALIREGRDAGEVTVRHGSELLSEMVMGAFYVLMFQWVNLEGYPLRERAAAAADFLAEAIAPGAPGGGSRPRRERGAARGARPGGRGEGLDRRGGSPDGGGGGSVARTARPEGRGGRG